MKNSSEGYFSAVKKMMPAKVTKPTVGLDIGSSSCRMVEVLNRPDGCELLKWTIEPVVAGDIVKSLRTLASKLSQPNLSLVTALTGKGTLIRVVEMPKMSLEDLKRSFSFEVDKYFPFPKDQIFTDCHILDQEAKDNKIPVLVVAAKKELVNERIKLMTDAGLPADSISLNPIALANVIGAVGAPAVQGGTQNASTLAILDIGEVVSNITIFLKNTPRFNRDIFIGGRDFTKAISAALKITVDEAEKVKRDPGARAAEVTPVLESVVQDFVSELRLSLDYFVTENNVSLEQLYITGGGSGMADLAQNLSKNLEMTVQAWDPFSQLKLGPGIAADQVRANSAQLTVALGLALS